ncbi:RES family NAD+ phosphorylase [Pseudoxanthomonas suwonensis]|uniref:RES domain-containing protein n=1 Tax=Pseudoxanthomonas suwonensis TaxID=314722 RepID=A0A0E3Z0W5_9GAMM|nr:RES family NAD+ phosphorylase [Pseudoxanthomonas suwonensis]AKC86304.1 hypothetical protein WQ53_05465 [Pseudoxanthomonas suwonensis]
MLASPPPDLATLSLDVVQVDPAACVRITRYPDTEPFFGKTGGNRFDDPLREYGVCYAGDDFLVAFAESILHDAVAVSGGFRVAESELLARHVVAFDGSELALADLTGIPLKRLGGTNDISSEVPYDMPQRWSRTVYAHPSNVDGLRYVSRHLNIGFAFALFDRAQVRMRRGTSVPLTEHPQLAAALVQFNIALL